MDIMTQLLTPHQESNRIYGLVVGLVTNNKDPDGMGRVKVRFPWLSDRDESHWARVATLMAGKDRGTFFLPEVGDEVLVAFEHGCLEFPYVLGALWNGQDNPPEANKNGKNNYRTIKSRSGHVVRMDDSDEDAKIEIQDGSGKNRIVLSTKDNAISIISQGDITIQSHHGKLVLKGQGIELNSQADATIQANQNMDIKGRMVNIN